MTKQESLKRRIRARMATTGERYVEARRVLLEQSGSNDSNRTWVSPPEMSNEAILNGTGKGWDEWCDLLDQFEGSRRGHKAIADHVRDDLGVDAWWAQGVTVGYERITGLRLPHQMSDGTFTANKSKTVNIDADELRHWLLDDEERKHLFPGIEVELKSKPDSKVTRLSIGSGVARISLDGRGDGRTKVTIQHGRLGTFEDVEEWKFFWSDWLDALDETGN